MFSVFGFYKFKKINNLKKLKKYLNSEVLNAQGDRLGLIVDLLFQPKTGNILLYFMFS